MSKTTNNDCPACYGKQAQCGKLPACSACAYAESCKFYAATPASGRYARDSKGHYISFEHYQFAEEIADKMPVYCDAEQPGADDYTKPVFSAADMLHMLEFLLRDVDDYTLAIVECALREDLTTASEIAKAFNVSREAIHRKVVDACKRYPHLADVLRCTLRRCKMLADPANRARIKGRKVKSIDNRGKSNNNLTRKNKGNAEF